jgi:hypothetical protein
VTATNPNYEAIRQLDDKLASLEKYYEVKTAVVSNATAADPLIAHIDGFDLMEWGYLVRELKSLSECPVPPGFSYAIMSRSNPEPLQVGEYERSVAA